MQSYQIVGPDGVVLATIVCTKMLFDLEYPSEHVIPLNDEVIAAKIVLGDGFVLRETKG